MDLPRARAITAMAKSRHAYNFGVLSMLGREDLAIAYEIAAQRLRALLVQRNALTGAGDLASLLAPVSPEARAVQRWVDEAVDQQEDAWRSIQAFIDRAAFWIKEVEITSALMPKST